MDQVLLIETGLFETRAAILQDGKLVDFHVERPQNLSKVGDFFLGRVSKIIPSLNAAFVDLGSNTTGFIQAQDIDRKSGDIGKLVHEGEKILVQVAKDGTGDKGPQLSCFYALKHRAFIYHPLGTALTFSRKISNKQDRISIRELIATCQITGGLTVRTEAQSLSPSDLKANLLSLARRWTDIDADWTRGGKPRPLGPPQTALSRILDTCLRADMSIILDNAAALLEAKRYLEKYGRHNASGIKLWEGQASLFEENQVEEQVELALQKHVPLSSGANISIEPTEAMVVIDVNSASHISAQGSKSNALTTNLAAAREIARQIRLRNLSGIIIIDFIQMSGKGEVKTLCEKMKKWLDDDPVRTRFAGMTELGLLQVTRERTQRPLAEILSVSCPICDGTGRQDSTITAISKLIRHLETEKLHGLPSHIRLEAGDNLAALLTEHKEKIENHLARHLTITENTRLPSHSYVVK
ncbi:MAG: hypothetical protein COB93_06845 [Sneathiella sp.]|nr:MAG: hypothetical protein COB93_06845 [Sneathiella sp.]